jgi:hypothetical protein
MAEDKEGCYDAVSILCHIATSKYICDKPPMMGALSQDIEDLTCTASEA